MDMKQPARLVAGLALITAQAFAQGSLTPPGAPAPTMKTLDQIEARTDLASVTGDTTYHHVILQPGSYYLSANIEITKTSGIRIAAAGVTLDLNGFEISRASGSGGIGINISEGMDRATVRNGSIIGFQYGIQCYANDFLLKGLAVSGCTSYGIYSTGKPAVITSCRAYDNPGSGIFTGLGAIVANCTATSNKGTYGINASSGSSLKNCIAYNNNCTYAIRASDGSTIEGCSAYNNIGTEGGSYGIYAGTCTTVKGCSAFGNGNTNSPGTSFEGTGIYARSGSIIKDCSVCANKGDGIYISSNCTVAGNTCNKNGNEGDGAGIHTSGSGNRIENNNVTNNDRGIDVDNVGNFIVRNTASGNTTDYDTVTGNDTGTIRTSPVDAGAWDNFSF